MQQTEASEADSKEGEWIALLPRLTRFYGVGPSDFISLPVGIFMAYVEMMPRLTAEESLTAMRRVAMGSGNMEKDVAKGIVREWRQMAAGNQDNREKPRKTVDRGAMAAAGIKVKAVKRNESR